MNEKEFESEVMKQLFNAVNTDRRLSQLEKDCDRRFTKLENLIEAVRIGRANINSEDLDRVIVAVAELMKDRLKAMDDRINEIGSVKLGKMAK